MRPWAPLALLATLASVSMPHVAYADVTLPAIFGDHMVLQRGMKVLVWGTADPGERVTVKVLRQEKSATADDKGNWRVSLEPLDAAEPVELTIAGKNPITLRDVLVGEVWLCSGQSNMAFQLKNATNGAQAVAAAERPKLRLFKVGRANKDEPQADLSGGWQVCTPETVQTFSAVAYFFGSELQDTLNVPVGLIEADWGGTRAEAWIPRHTFDALKLPYEPEWTERWLHPKQNPDAKKPEPARPHQAPACLYNGMIAPIAGYAMRGAAWYQGETNTAYPAEYRRVLGSLVTSWRSAWGQGDFPFLVVQLPNFRGPTRDWATLRASQAQVAAELPNVGLAVTIDLGESRDIHPRNKQPVGHRLSLLARHLAYDQNVPFSGPTVESVKTAENEAVIALAHAHGGLVARGGELLGFELAGADGRFVPATARIDGERVVVSAAGVTSPAAVRYAWANDPKCTLYSAAGLPAAPFAATVR